MANNFYPAIALTGGGTGALDAIDGAGLADMDGALVITQAGTYIYTLDADSGAAENSPLVISPDANAGTKRWILQFDSTASANAGAMTPLPKSGDATLSNSEASGSIVYLSATGTITLPAVSGITTGSMLVVYSTGANIIHVDPNASDRIRLNGSALTDGNKVSSGGEAGNYIALHNDSADGWTVVGRSGYWFDGGA